MPVFDPVTDRSALAAVLADGKTRLVACLCAAWSGTCREYAQTLEALAARYPELCFVWVDIETHADWLDKSFRRSAQIKRYASVAEALQALVEGEVDAVFGDKVELWLWSQKPEGQCCTVMGQDIKDTQTLGIGVSAGIRREDIKLREAFNKAIGAMMSDGTYKKINEKYFPFPLN